MSKAVKFVKEKKRKKITKGRVRGSFYDGLMD